MPLSSPKNIRKWYSVLEECYYNERNSSEDVHWRETTDKNDLFAKETVCITQDAVTLYHTIRTVLVQGKNVEEWLYGVYPTLLESYQQVENKFLSPSLEDIENPAVCRWVLYDIIAKIEENTESNISKPIKQDQQQHSGFSGVMIERLISILTFLFEMVLYYTIYFLMPRIIFDWFLALNCVPLHLTI